MASLLKPEELQQYVVKGTEAEFAAANGRSVSIKSSREVGAPSTKRKEGGMLYAKTKKKKVKGGGVRK